MLEYDRIRVAEGEGNPCNLLLNQVNRHGLIAGATGTGKTVTLKVIAEGLSKAGVPVFMADVKGDVSGMAQRGLDSDDMQERIERFHIDDWRYEGCPCRFWDITEGWGIPIRLTVSDMGPMMFSRLLGLSDAQEGVLNLVFRVADDMGMLLIDLKDLRAMLNYVGSHASEYEMTYGHVSSQSIGTILRELISIEEQGGDIFFGEPAIDIEDWFAVDENGEGIVNILNAKTLVQKPQIYAMFLLWMLGELFNILPEVGDLDKPKFVFFFDEAHLLFKDMPSELLDKLVQVVKLIRSKGVGVYFITQSPSDIPDDVLAQLNNRVQHGLRAYTPAEQKAVRAAAQTFRQNPAFDCEEAIMALGKGEALISFLDEDGRPSVVENAKVLPPQCLMAAADDDVVDLMLELQADINDKYDDPYDRESAYEMIVEVEAQAEREAALAAERAQLEKERAALEKARAKEEERARREFEREREREAAAARRERERMMAAAQRELEREMKKRRDAEIREIEREREKLARERERLAGKRSASKMRTGAGRTSAHRAEPPRGPEPFGFGGPGPDRRRSAATRSNPKRGKQPSRGSADAMADLVEHALGDIGRAAQKEIRRSIMGSRKRW